MYFQLYVCKLFNFTIAKLIALYLQNSDFVFKPDKEYIRFEDTLLGEVCGDVKELSTGVGFCVTDVDAEIPGQVIPVLVPCRFDSTLVSFPWEFKKGLLEITKVATLELWFSCGKKLFCCIPTAVF